MILVLHIIIGSGSAFLKATAIGRTLRRGRPQLQIMMAEKIQDDDLREGSLLWAQKQYGRVPYGKSNLPQYVPLLHRVGSRTSCWW